MNILNQSDCYLLYNINLCLFNDQYGDLIQIIGLIYLELVDQSSAEMQITCKSLGSMPLAMTIPF